MTGRAILDLAAAPALGTAWLVAAAAVASWLAVGLVREYALRRGVIDRPNERSSHRIPTPRGGGLGIVAVLLLAAPVCAAASGVAAMAAAALCLAVAAVAAVGWLDDHAGLSVGPRLVVHLVAAAAVAVVLTRAGAGGPVPLPLPTWAAWAWWLLWSVSAINVVNFMDGIDGLIASQLAIYGVYVLVAAPSGSSTAALGSIVAGASVGFLAWNWAPARIFLGDVGSGALGLAVVVAGASLVRDADTSVVRAYLPLLPLFADAAITLARRAARGERIWSAHREHLYQRLANGPWSHARTSLVYAALAAIGAVVGLTVRGYPFVAAAAVYTVIVVTLGGWLERTARASLA